MDHGGIEVLVFLDGTNGVGRKRERGEEGRKWEREDRGRVEALWLSYLPSKDVKRCTSQCGPRVTSELRPFDLSSNRRGDLPPLSTEPRPQF